MMIEVVNNVALGIGTIFSGTPVSSASEKVCKAKRHILKIKYCGNCTLFILINNLHQLIAEAIKIIENYSSF